MMISRRKAVSVLLATGASVLVVLALSLNAFINKNREWIREEIEKGLGRPVRFDALRLSLWGGVGLLVSHLNVAEDPRFAATPLIQARELRIQLRWLPLLTGNIEIKRFVLDEPEFQIIRNEEGALNLSALAGPERKAGETRARGREAGGARRRTAVSFFPAAVAVSNGKIDYIDRSFKEPVEIQARDIQLDVRAPTLSGSARVKLSASLFNGPGEKLGVDGRIGPVVGERDWSRLPLELQIRLDSFHLSQLSRAVPFLRDDLAPYLALSGSLAARGKLAGTLERPRITDLTVTGPVLGAAENNATLKGTLDFSQADSWSGARVRGKIAVDRVSLDSLKRVPLFQRAFPSSLIAEGPMSVTAEIEGSPADFKVSSRLLARESDLRYGSWFHKPGGVPAELEVNAERQNDRIAFPDSTLTVQNLKVKFSGFLQRSPQRPLTLRVRCIDGDLTGWEKLLPRLSSYKLGGIVRCNLSLKKNLGLPGAGLDAEGTAALDRLQAKDQKSGRGLEKMNAQLLFQGKEARIANGEGIWDNIPVANLKGGFSWGPSGLILKGLSFQALGGTARASGAWEGGDDARRVSFEPDIESIDLHGLASQELPDFKEHVEGKLSFKARLRGESRDGASLRDSLQGEGSAQVRAGALKNFNLLERVLSKATLPGVPNLLSSRLPDRYNAMLRRKDTQFESLAGTFTVKQGRAYSKDFSLVTPDYSVQGEGWVGFDRSMKWDGAMILSPQFTQDLLKEHKNARYAVDKQGRLSLPFRVEGTLPYVQVRPDLQGLAGAIQRGVERALERDQKDKKKGKRDWLRKGLEQLFGK